MEPNFETRVARIANLAVGETHSEAVRIKCSAIDHGVVSAAADRLRNNMKPAVSRAAETTGSQYNLQSLHGLVGGDSVLVVLAATRWT